MLSEMPQRLADPGIPTLQAVLNPSELGQHLRPILPPNWGALRDTQIEVLRLHRGSRCTISITLQTTSGQHDLIGKVHAEDRSAVYRVMKQIAQSGFGSDAEFAIPEPLAFIPKLHLLLQEKVRGPLAKKAFANGEESNRIAAAERCAQWLAHFHIRAPRSGQRPVATQEVSEHWVRGLTRPAGHPDRAFLDKETLLLKRLKSAAATIDTTQVSACHGGYCPNQIILTETRTVTFDWDSYCVSDPTCDVAKFIIKLQQIAHKSHGSRKALDPAIETFCKTYTARSTFDVARNLPFYKAKVCLVRARRQAGSGTNGLENAETMLDEGLRILAEEVN